MTGLHWKFEINISVIISIIVLGGGMWIGFTKVVTRVEVQAVEVSNLRSTVEALQSRVQSADTLAEAKVAGVEQRTRTMEIGYAGMSSDIRNILIGQNDMKAVIDRLAAQPARGLK